MVVRLFFLCAIHSLVFYLLAVAPAEADGILPSNHHVHAGDLAFEKNVAVGVASWYGTWHQGRRTASGEDFDMNGLTAAHRTLPLNTRVVVTNLTNGRSVNVRINDRGPYLEGRDLDLSERAAEEIGMKESGLATVEIDIVR